MGGSLKLQGTTQGIREEKHFQLGEEEDTDDSELCDLYTNSDYELEHDDFDDVEFDENVADPHVVPEFEEMGYAGYCSDEVCNSDGLESLAGSETEEDKERNSIKMPTRLGKMKLYPYIRSVEIKNPSSRLGLLFPIVEIVIKMDGPVRRFKRMYLCFQAYKHGWMKGCRPLIGLDGCHIKGHHPEQLLATIGIDANNEFFLIAYAMVERESEETWTWFLEYLQQDVKIERDSNYVFIIDKQKGLDNALNGMQIEGKLVRSGDVVGPRNKKMLDKVGQRATQYRAHRGGECVFQVTGFGKNGSGFGSPYMHLQKVAAQ
ncbi:hypothetical protein ACLB2K_032207 [Fragaria x ananassa]